jgi:2-polyprenyl-6-methoxyphenol hydroxylase-like FAD-dependent oxidoreductase
VNAPRSIAIVGAGLAGLAAAVAATAAGAHVDVFEAGPQRAAPPAHLDVVPPLMRDLVALGVGEACVRLGFAYQGVAFVDTEGRPVFEVATPALAGARWPAAMGMSYGALLEVLHAAALRQGACFHWGSAVQRVESSARGGRVRFGDSGLWEGDLALVAGAQGLAPAAWPAAPRETVLPQRWDHALLARPRGLDRATWVLGPGRRKALLVPTGATQAGVAVLRELHADSSAAALRAQLQAQGPWLAAVAAGIGDDTVVVPRPVRSALLGGAWHDGAVLRIGNSAHRLPPHFGQAAAQAAEDAVVLLDLLQQGLDRAPLLERFMGRRGARAAQVHAVATQAAQWDLKPEPGTDLPALARRLAPIVAHAA